MRLKKSIKIDQPQGPHGRVWGGGVTITLPKGYWRISFLYGTPPAPFLETNIAPAPPLRILEKGFNYYKMFYLLNIMY